MAACALWPERNCMPCEAVKSIAGGFRLVQQIEQIGFGGAVRRHQLALVVHFGIGMNRGLKQAPIRKAVGKRIDQQRGAQIGRAVARVARAPISDLAYSSAPRLQSRRR